MRGASNVFMSAVSTVTFVSPAAAASASMYSFCERELETAVNFEPGNFAACIPFGGFSAVEAPAAWLNAP